MIDEFTKSLRYLRVNIPIHLASYVLNFHFQNSCFMNIFFWSDVSAIILVAIYAVLGLVIVFILHF